MTWDVYFHDQGGVHVAPTFWKRFRPHFPVEVVRVKLNEDGHIAEVITRPAHEEERPYKVKIKVNIKIPLSTRIVSKPSIIYSI